MNNNPLTMFLESSSDASNLEASQQEELEKRFNTWWIDHANTIDVDYETQKRFDLFSATALQALIQKAPFYDLEGLEGKKVSEDELQVIKKGISRTAMEYACWMIKERPDFIDYLNQLGRDTTDKVSEEKLK